MQYKWAQLDLARQMETPEFIKSFIDILAEAGYNGIELYLEDRIQTPSYPWAAEGTFYTPEQMRDIIAHAETKGMEVIPCVATLGHAERFLAHPELANLAEIQGDTKGRFPEDKSISTFCPSNPKFYEFMENYLVEVAAIFPSKFFHIGLDEFWDFCFCPACRKAAPDHKSQGLLFANHIRRINDTLKAVGKRCMMWSDMFEFYENALENTPRDVIMVDWQYQPDVRFYLQHMCDCTVENRLELNKKLGFETFLGPVDMQLSNPRSYLEYARKDLYTGCLLTSWEKTDTFHYRTLPVFVYTGYLMNGKSDNEAFEAMMLQLFGTNDPILAAAIRMVNTTGLWRHFDGVSFTRLFSRNFYGIDYSTNEQDASAKTILQERIAVVKTDLGKTIVTDMIDALTDKCIAHQISAFYNEVFDGRSPDWNRLEALNADYIAYMDRMAEIWDKNRPTIPGNTFRAKRDTIATSLNDNMQALKTSRFLKVRFCLPDGYGRQHVRISLQFEDKGPWVEITDDVYKQQELNTAMFEYFFAYNSPVPPKAVKIDSYGLGGIGICWLETPGFTPSAIKEISGIVNTPEKMLLNDVQVAWFGLQSTRATFVNTALADVLHTAILE